MNQLNPSLLPQDYRGSTKFIVDLLRKVSPLILRIRSKLQLYNGDEDDATKIRDVYSLCSSQIKKCVLNLLEIFKMEYHQKVLLQESRQCNLERLSWCVERLISIEEFFEKANCNSNEPETNSSILVTVMYFVNWIDHTFEVLNKLANVIYKTDYKDSSALFDLWKNEMVECVSGVYISIDELLLSAMTLCRYSLPGDQLIIKARCQVVLRETKALLSDLIDGDLSSTKATPESLKLPIMPSNVNVLIDVLKDVLYVLETNTNTALLALLIHCFSYNVCPVDVLKYHFSSNTNGTCSCLVKSDHEITEDCTFVKDFDLYNERLLQIGSFAVSCSSDQNRILSLRSGLASLEALDPHLVPALMTSPESRHAEILMKSWSQEILEIRDSVFLIVDPAAFAEKSKQMMHQRLLEVLNEDSYNNSHVCSVINIGCVVDDFFSVYDKYEPTALTQHEKLITLLTDLNKVQKECKIVSNLLSTEGDFIYDIKMPSNKNVTSLDQLLKRLKLLYTLVTKINELLRPKENDDQFLSLECDIEPMKNVTHTVYKSAHTYVNSPQNAVNNMTRSIFARTTNIRSSTRHFPLAKLTKHLKNKQIKDLSFSVQLDNLFNGSEDSENHNGTDFVNKQLDLVRENSILYNFSPIKRRSSLRKAVLNKYKNIYEKDDPALADDSSSERESLNDETTSLQITEVLNQLNDMTSIISTTRPVPANSTRMFVLDEDRTSENGIEKKNILTLNINNKNPSVSKHIWNIPVNASAVDMTMDGSAAASNISNVTQPSNITTLERMSDLDFVEYKLNSLKSQLETSL